MSSKKEVGFSLKPVKLAFLLEKITICISNIEKHKGGYFPNFDH